MEEFHSLGRYLWCCKEKIKKSDSEKKNCKKGSQQEELHSINEEDCVSSSSNSS